MVSTHVETERLIAVRDATTLGRRADKVVLAAIHWKQTRNLAGDDADAVKEGAEWLDRLASVLSDPLDLEHNLSALGELDVLGRSQRFGERGISILLKSQPGSPSTPPAEAVHALRTIADLLREWHQGKVDEAHVSDIQRIFERLASMMLESAEETLGAPTGARWKTTSAF